MKNLIEKKLLKFKIYENPQILPDKFAKVCSSENDEKNGGFKGTTVTLYKWTLFFAIF